MGKTIDTAEAARLAGVSGDTVRRWARLGYLHPVRVGPGRRYRIDADELAAVMDGSVLDAMKEPTQRITLDAPVHAVEAQPLRHGAQR